MATALAGCAMGGGDELALEDMEELEVSCSGKCDGLGDRIRSIYDQARRVDTGDLMSLGVGLATDELNDALAYRGAAARLDAPALYALAEDARGDLTLRDIDALTTGLAAQYGERELTTAVNRLRRDHLASTDDRVFAEAAFAISGTFDHGWSYQTGGLGAGDAWATVGFDAGGALESRVIAAFPSEARAQSGSILAAIRESRGFVIPRSVDDLRAMKPGESFALSGNGALGINVGAGVPILVAQPASAVTYSIVISGALRARLEGGLDIQAVRMDDDRVVVDVGSDRYRIASAMLAISDGWGVSGLVRSHVQLGGFRVDLGTLVEKALQNQLNARMNLIEARLERSGRRSRVSVARFTFHLDAMDAAGAQALAQALKGDVRLAQALSNQQHAAVDAEFDLLRTGESTTSYAGIDLLGMRFFTSSIESRGTTVVQTPGGVRTLMFDSLHKESGWFFSTRGYTRVGLSGLVFDPARPASPEGEVNLFVQALEGDEWMQRDKLLDHLDALILAVAGMEAFRVFDDAGNRLEAYVESRCSPSGDPFAPCRTSVLADPMVVSTRAESLAALERAVADLPSDQQRLVLDAARLRLAAQATVEPAAALVGPPSSVVLDYRLDDAALSQLFVDRRGEDLSRALAAYLAVAEVSRRDRAGRLSDTVTRMGRAHEPAIAAIARVFEEARDPYAALLSAENASVRGLGELGANAVELRFPVDAERGVLYERATLRSLAEARSEVVVRAFDRMLSEAAALPGLREQAVAYSLLALTPAHHQDVRLDVRMSLRNRISQNYDHYRAAGYAPLDVYARGAAVQRIDGGLFSLDALVRVD